MPLNSQYTLWMAITDEETKDGRLCSHCMTQWHLIWGEAALGSQHILNIDVYICDVYFQLYCTRPKVVQGF